MLGNESSRNDVNELMTMIWNKKNVTSEIFWFQIQSKNENKKIDWLAGKLVGKLNWKSWLPHLSDAEVGKNINYYYGKNKRIMMALRSGFKRD